MTQARHGFKPELTQDALSGRLARLGVQLDRAAIAKIENSYRYVLDYELKALANVLGVEVNWLLLRDAVRDSCSLLRSATRRAKSDVANKLISMFLHELSKVTENWPTRVDGKQYEDLVRRWFNNQCPYCPPAQGSTHPGMCWLHVKSAIAKSADDSSKTLSLANSGWESFLSHDGTRCAPLCLTCQYWKSIWEDETPGQLGIYANLQKLRSFRCAFSEFERVFPSLAQNLPSLLTKLYCDCQSFAEKEIKSLLDDYNRLSAPQV